MTSFILATLLSLPIQIQGTLKNQDNEPVAGAIVVALRSGDIATSSEMGTFYLANVYPGDTVLVTHIGYEEKLIVLSDASKVMHLRLSPAAFQIDQLVIKSQRDPALLFNNINIRKQPVQNSQELLLSVPGLFIGQHAGGGKAEQLFMRGFDIDHGTDIALSVDGVPVNMVSHAHGQGYADLHFVIPETVARMTYGKGPYSPDQGNFATAGYVEMKLKESIDQVTLKAEAGSFGWRRLLGILPIVSKENHTLYMAMEGVLQRGYFESPQDFHRVNALMKYAGSLGPKDRLTLTASHFQSQWLASGQIPERAVATGMITRFGAIDDTEGGVTGRSQLYATHTRMMNDRLRLQNTAWLSYYQFDLYSNFTFFLDDPIYGDQIRQQEERLGFGGGSKLQYAVKDGYLEAGINIRQDHVIDNALSHTWQRQQTLERKQFGDVSERNVAAFAQARKVMGKFTFQPGIRIDHLNFQYRDHLTGLVSQAQAAAIGPKFMLTYAASDDLQLYAKAGQGFHSNDTRTAIRHDGSSAAPAARGMDLGLIWKPIPELMLHATAWQLNSNEEFVYVGDAGIVEQGGRSRRQGFELSLRAQPRERMFAYFDLTYSNPVSIDELAGEQYIPLAPLFTATGGIHIEHRQGHVVGLKARGLSNRPANEDASIVADGYALFDLFGSLRKGRWTLDLHLTNLMNTQWNEAQFATESRLQDEVKEVEEIHFTPGSPRGLRLGLSREFGGQRPAKKKEG